MLILQTDLFASPFLLSVLRQRVNNPQQRASHLFYTCNSSKGSPQTSRGMWPWQETEFHVVAPNQWRQREQKEFLFFGGFFFFFFSPQVGEQKRSIKSKFFFCSKRNLNAVILLSRDSHYDWPIRSTKEGIVSVLFLKPKQR